MGSGGVGELIDQLEGYARFGRRRRLGAVRGWMGRGCAARVPKIAPTEKNKERGESSDNGRIAALLHDTVYNRDSQTA